MSRYLLTPRWHHAWRFSQTRYNSLTYENTPDNAPRPPHRSPRNLSDESGTWRSSIFRERVDGPIELGERGLAGDKVADTRNHGSPDQAVCAHSLAHYDHWNEFYGLTGDAALGPGGVGENWTVEGALEADLCIGDILGWAARGSR